MIPKECKRLIEVDFPIAEVSKQSAREKSIRHGHPSTLHLWWARRLKELGAAAPDREVEPLTPVEVVPQALPQPTNDNPSQGGGEHHE